jgi:hypothetical protein
MPLPEDSSDNESSDDSLIWSARSSGSSSYIRSFLSSETIEATGDKSIHVSSGPDTPIMVENAPVVSDTHTDHDETAIADDGPFMVSDDSIKTTVVKASAVPDSGKPTVITINGIPSTVEEAATLSISYKSDEASVIDTSATPAPKEPTTASASVVVDCHVTQPIIEYETASSVTVPEKRTAISTSAHLPVDGGIVTTNDMDVSCFEAHVA